MQQVLENYRLILMEAAVVEQLRRASDIALDPDLVHAHLIYSATGRQRLKMLYQSYINIAVSGRLPFIMCTPTWRANRERVSRALVDANINCDAVEFMREMRDNQSSPIPIRIGGLIGCKNDCYTPDDGLTATEAEGFHSWQINQLSEKGVDFLMGATLPCVEEALGIARAMARTGDPYVLGFVIDRNGRILDGTGLLEASGIIDTGVERPPLGYMVGCAYPTFLQAKSQPREFMQRLIGYQANASSLDHCDLEGADTLLMDNITEWGNEMVNLNRDHGIRILGGCCGTGVKHLEYIVNALKDS